MMKFVIAILVFVAALAGILLYVGEAPGLTIQSIGAVDGFKSKLNFEGQVSWQAIIVITTIFTIVLLAFWSFLSWLWNLPTRLRTGHGLRRGARALDAVEEALLAGADGDADKARKKATKAQSLIKSSTLGHLIRAQTAESADDLGEAITHYTALLDNDRTKTIAEKGLVRLSMAGGNLEEVVSRAGEAFSQDKPAKWAFDPLFRARVMNGDWHEAIDVLATAVKGGFIDKVAARRRRAVLMTAEAQRIMRTEGLNDSGIAESTKDMAVKVAQESPDFAPGVALAAQILSERNEVKSAAKVIEKAWAKAPHPALSLAYRDLFHEASDEEKSKRYGNLIKQNPNHRESTILQVETALEKGDYVQAWSLLNHLVSYLPTARLCALAARAEDGLSNSADARMWLERGLSAPSEADWSDLDPEGSGFNYTVRDWQRLVFTFGETGELIHPRLETGAARKKVKTTTDEAPQDETPQDETPQDEAPQDETTQDATLAEQADLSEELVPEDNLAARLDSLLDDSDNTPS